MSLLKRNPGKHWQQGRVWVALRCLGWMEFCLVWSGCWMQIGTLADSSCPRRARLSRHRPITAHTASISPCSAQNCLPVFLRVLTSIFCQYFAVQCPLPSTTLYVSGTVLLTSTLISMFPYIIEFAFCCFSHLSKQIYMSIFIEKSKVFMWYSVRRLTQCKAGQRGSGSCLEQGIRHHLHYHGRGQAGSAR